MTTWNTTHVTKQGDNGVEMETHVTEYTDPPILSGYSVQEIKCMDQDNKVPNEVYDLPCHNQKVERAIKLVTETSKKARTKMEREGIVNNVISSRK